MLGGLAAAYAGICEVLLLKRNAAALYTACFVLELILAGGISAPHCFDEARVVLRGVDEFLVGSRDKGLFLGILRGAVVHILVDSLEQVFNVIAQTLERNKCLFSGVAAYYHALVLLDVLGADLNSYGHALHLILGELPAGSVVAVVELYAELL